MIAEARGSTNSTTISGRDVDTRPDPEGSGILTEKQLQEAIQHQVLYGGRLGTSLYELGMITEEKLQDALARAHGLAPGAVDYRDIEEAAVALVSRTLAARHKVCPYKVKGKTLFLLMVDPSDHATLAKVGFSLGYIIKPMVVPEFRMIRLLRDHYDVDERWRFTDTHRRDAGPVMPLSEGEAAERLDSALTGRSGERRRRRQPPVLPPRRVLHRARALGAGLERRGGGNRRGARLAPAVPLDEPSVFQSVTRDKTLFIGRFGPEPANQEFLRSIGKRPATNAVLLPIAVKAASSTSSSATAVPRPT